MRYLLSLLFYLPGGILLASAVIYSVILSFEIVFSVFPAWAAYLSFVFFPFVYGIAPFDAAFAMGDWTLLILSYVGWIPGGILIFIGNKIAGE